MHQYIFRSFLIGYTILIILAAFPSYLPLLPRIFQAAVVIVTVLCALTGLALLPFVAILTVSILSTDEERNLKKRNLYSCASLFLIAMFTFTPLLSFLAHAANQ